MFTINDYRIAQKKINEYNVECSEIERTNKEKQRELDNILYDKKRELQDRIYKLERENDKTIEDINELSRKNKENALKKIESHISLRNHLKLLFKLFDRYLEPSPLSWRKDPIITLHDDKYKKIGFYIKKNGNSVNCYSLMIMIDSIFSRMDGVINIWDDEEVKTAHSEKALLEWAEKNIDKMRINRTKQTLPELLVEHKRIEEAYEEAIMLFKDVNWRKAYWEYKKKYYEQDYSGGTSTEMYKGVCKAIDMCNMSQKEIIPMVGRYPFKEVKQEFDMRLG